MFQNQLPAETTPTETQNTKPDLPKPFKGGYPMAFPMHPNLFPMIIPRQPPLKKKLGEFQFSLDHKLGSGLTSDVYLGLNTITNEQICVKVIDKLNFSRQQQKVMLQNEIRCQRSLKCENIVKLYDIFQTQTFTFMISEFCQHGDLFKLIQLSKNGLEQKLAKSILRDIARGLFQLKSKEIVHRDIKSENILLHKGVAKIGDFGFAIENKSLNQKEKFNLGSPLYMSLEALKENKYSYASDVFAFGVVAHQMLHKESPWECNDEQQLKKKIEEEQVEFKSGLSEDIQNLIKGCLVLDPAQRLTIEQIMELDFIKTQLESQSKEEKLPEEEQKAE